MQQLLNEPTPVGRRLNNLERGIAAAWSSVLGVPLDQIPATSEWAPLGGTEELLSALSDHIYLDLHVRADPAQLAATPALEDMALLVKKLGRAAYGHPAPPRQLAAGDPARHPVFLVAGMGAHTKSLEVLSTLLSPEIPVYGMESAAFDA